MTQITLIRHGQANNSATDEAGYDRLSDLGRQQARWLGEHMRATGQAFDAVFTGTLTRHKQTAEEWGAAEVRSDSRLNEVRYFDLSERMHAQYGLAHPKSHEDFVDHLPLTFSAWQEGKIDGAPESFHDFQTRVQEVIHDIAQAHENPIIFTSGGFIGMATRVVMGLDIGPFTRAILPIMNSSVHRMRMLPAGLTLTQFNGVPHLEHPDRHHAQTHF
ncbi:histidine phosphatase family protein [Aliiroseovarius crassostreae]|uniref:histidine phosphatase family protein n=1 Tax=Aliiroseovarius crassostreae TaxID=154981 RepID=UPI0021FC3764|nr:histidine phosphatase family protein [Aliiroseovarius crassostreae]UWP88659.1 histidine phosphatase family protein [Aliiroseovarius crassostreae]